MSEMTRIQGWMHLHSPGIGGACRILTSAGPVLAAKVRRGDMVVTRRGYSSVVAVREIALPQSASAVRVTQDALDGRPNSEMILLPSQRIFLRDWRARLYFGRNIAAPPVVQLVDDEKIVHENDNGTRFFSIYVGAPEVLIVEGLELASADQLHSQFYRATTDFNQQPI